MRKERAKFGAQEECHLRKRNKKEKNKEEKMTNRGVQGRDHPE
jgi:hypothetical protein